MDSTISPVSEVFINNGEIEWQPLALTLVEYPKGIYIFLFNFNVAATL